jgi:alcohol dehydrogenase (cytochrome c)
MDVMLSRDTTTLFCPGTQGGVEWNGAAYSPQTNALYVGAVDWCTRARLTRDTLTIPAPGGLGWLGAANADLQTPVAQARGWITAFDADDGSVRWKFQTPTPVLDGVTPTAGGLLFAADLSGQLYAFDVNDGRVLWQHATGQSTGGGIVTYIVGGQQRVGVASGMNSPVWPGAAQQSRIQVYGLR